MIVSTPSIFFDWRSQINDRYSAILPLVVKVSTSKTSIILEWCRNLGLIMKNSTTKAKIFLDWCSQLLNGRLKICAIYTFIVLAKTKRCNILFTDFTELCNHFHTLVIVSSSTFKIQKPNFAKCCILCSGLSFVCLFVNNFLTTILVIGRWNFERWISMFRSGGD